MQDTDMLLFRHKRVAKSSQFELSVHDMWGIGNMIPDEDEMRGGQNDWNLLGYEYNNQTNVIRTKVRRRLTTQDDFDFVFEKQDLKVSYAFGNNTGGKLRYHGANRGVITLELSKNDTRNLLTIWGDFVFRGHTILLFVFWGVVADIGVFFARQLKSYPKYAKVHGMIFLFQSILTYFFVFAMINLNKEKIQEIGEESDLLIAHFSIGLVILGLMTLQLFFGMMVKNNLESLNGSERVYRLKRLHQIFGYFLYIFTKINVAIGVEMFQPDYLFWFYAYYILLFLLKFTIEMLYLFEVSIIPRRRLTYHYIENEKNFLYERLLDRINNNTPRYDVLKEFPKLRYVILREAIYDISDFNHPGGQFIMEAIKGREVGRYFYGGSPVEKLDIEPHKHSAFAINYIETRYIGDYKNEVCPLLYHPEVQDKTVTTTDRYIWKFKENRKISNSCSLFIFQTSYFQVRQNLKGVAWFGRYFYIKPYGAGQYLAERPYSVILSLSDENIRYRQKLIDFFKSMIIDNGQSVHVDPPRASDNMFSNTLCFLIKRQAFSQNMSRFLHDTYHKPYEITGPYGLGLELDEHSNGIHYIFCNGTGILPFLDLFDFLLKKALYTVLYDKCGPEIAERMNPHGEEFLNTFGSDFQIHLCGSFKNQNEFHGYPIVQDLYFICQSFGLPYFNMSVRLGDKGKSSTSDIQQYNYIFYYDLKFDAQLVASVIKYQPTKVYVCGSPDFEEELLSYLKGIGVHKRNIVIV